MTDQMENDDMRQLKESAEGTIGVESVTIGTLIRYPYLFAASILVASLCETQREMGEQSMRKDEPTA